MKVAALKRIVCFCIVSVLVCAGLSAAEPNKTYTDSLAGYRLEYPARFSIKQMGSATVFSSPEEDKRFAFSPSVNIVVIELKSVPTDLALFYRQSKDALERSLGEIKFIEDKKTTLAGVDAYRLVYGSRQKKADFKFLQILCIRNMRAYVVTYTALQEQYGRSLKTAEAMIKSFHFIKKNSKGGN